MIRVEKIQKKFGETLAVKELSLEVRKGEVLGILGPNGAGKTTTLRIIAGYLKPKSGSVFIEDWNMMISPEECKMRIGYLPESAPLPAEMSVFDYLTYIGKLRGLGRKTLDAQIDRLSSTCRIREVMHRKQETLSKGYRQRVGIASILLADPPVLILDEPASGLDPSQMQDFRNLIRNICSEKAIIFSTHILSEAEVLCDRILVVNRGQIAAKVPSRGAWSEEQENQRLRLELEGREIKSLENALESLDYILQWDKIDSTPGETVLTVHTKGDQRRRVFQLIKERDLTLLEMHLEKRSLEDLYREITGEARE